MLVTSTGTYILAWLPGCLFKEMKKKDEGCVRKLQRKWCQYQDHTRDNTAARQLRTIRDCKYWGSQKRTYCELVKINVILCHRLSISFFNLQPRHSVASSLLMCLQWFNIEIRIVCVLNRLTLLEHPLEETNATNSTMHSRYKISSLSHVLNTG